VHGIAGDDRAAARERAGAPIELVGIAGGDIDIGDVDAELVGDDLGKDGEVPLPLRADAGRDIDLAVRLHLYLGAFIGTNARAFDIAGNADADMAALGAQPRLLLGEEFFVVDHRQRLVEDRLVIAAVIGERREVLIDDLVVVGKRTRRNEIAPAYFSAVDLQ